MDRLDAFSICYDSICARLGTAAGRFLLDVREPAEFSADRAQIAGAVRRPLTDAHLWRAQLRQGRVIALYCHDGTGNSPRLMQWLIEGGVEAVYLDSGIDEWRRKSFVTWRRTGRAPTQWVTRERPKVDRIACPWLVRRFIDPKTIFYYVPSANVTRFSTWSGVVPYDVDRTEFGQRGDNCGFDAFLTVFRITDAALDRVAVIVRGADTGKHQLTPQSPSLLAPSLGLSMTMAGDLEQLENGMFVYGALYALCRQQAAA